MLVVVALGLFFNPVVGAALGVAGLVALRLLWPRRRGGGALKGPVPGA